LVLSGNFEDEIEYMKQYLGFFFFISILTIACSPNNVKSDANIVKILDSAKLKGTFALMENGSAEFTITNLSMYKDSAFAPFTSFFAVPSLIALDKGYINHTATSWVRNDSVAYYQSIIEKIGRVDLLKTLDSMHYGKGIIGKDLNTFWRDSSLRITPDEQLGFIKKLYFSQLPFQKRSQDIYKQMILKENNTSYKLSYVYGTAESATAANWVIGYVEENKHPYFFVMYVVDQNTQQKNSEAKTVTVLKSILTQQGFLKGVR
jgi:beta-lactamase class D